MKTKIILIITLTGLLIIPLFFILINSHFYKKCCTINSDPIKRCELTKVPNADRRKLLNAKDVMMYYKLDDNCNFQTLTFNHLATPDLRIPAYTILGRFTTKKENTEIYRIERLETRFYDFTNPINKISYSIIDIDLNPISTPNNVIFNLTYERNQKLKEPFVLDYIYGLKPDEPAIRVYPNAKISFIANPYSSDPKDKPIHGEYECNGKAIISN